MENPTYRYNAKAIIEVELEAGDSTDAAVLIQALIACGRNGLTDPSKIGSGKVTITCTETTSIQI